MKKDSIPMAVVTAFLAASQLSFSLPTREARTVPGHSSLPAELSDGNDASGPSGAGRR